MANLLTITKEANDYFTFVLNGDTASAIKNTRNDLTAVGNLCHFKTSNGANLIKEQDVLFNNVTIIDVSPLPAPVSMDDLFVKLISVNFFDWINGTGSGGVNRFDELEDTFQYFGKDGQGIKVNESQLRLEPYVLPNTDYLNNFPTPLIANKILKVDPTASFFLFVDPPAGSAGMNLEFEYVGGDPEFLLPSDTPLSAVLWNGVGLRKSDWTQALNILIINFTPDIGAIFQPIGNI